MTPIRVVMVVRSPLALERADNPPAGVACPPLGVACGLWPASDQYAFEGAPLVISS